MKCCIQNLALEITKKCNLNCKHCLRGKQINETISDDVIKATFDQIGYVHNLAITGGEVTLAIPEFEKVINYIIERKVLLDKITLYTNGVIYSKKLLKLLDKIDEYIEIYNESANSELSVSFDQYHLRELENLGLRETFFDNLKKYQENKHFYAVICTHNKLFREGNACNLDKSLTTPLKTPQIILTYADGNGNYNLEKGLCNIGPIMAVATDGTITEHNSSYEHEKELYNYGNVLNDELEDIALSRGLIVKPKKFEKVLAKSMRKANMKYDKM